VEVGPVEYVVIEFPGDRFDASIARAIARLVDDGVVRILDLVLVRKDEAGAVRTFEYDELAELTALGGDAEGMLSEGDVADLAEDLAPGSAALFITWEDLWAVDLGRAVLGAGGQLVAGGRIPNAVVMDALAALDEDDDEDDAEP
jgi:uncharacterized membrane protein